MLRYVARRFAPIYLSLLDSLCDSEILSGDDTSCRVLEVSRHFAESAAGAPAPWSAYRTREAARQCLAVSPDATESLAAALSSELGFEFGRRNGDGAKKALHTTTVSGRSDASDPRSLVVIYRSHLGAFGNVLEMLLAKRSPKAKALTIQSDLATVNLVADAELRRRFDIRHVGCASHARRPFALYEDEDPESCGLMLHLFQGLFLHEQNLSATGRNAENVTALRRDDSRPVWVMIKELASEMSQQWSRETKLGEGARYITRNLRMGVLPESPEEALPALLRPETTELWSMDSVAPVGGADFAVRLIPYLSGDETPMTLIDPFRGDSSNRTQPRAHNYLVTGRADGGLDVSPAAQYGIVSPYGEDLVAVASSGAAFFQVWCTDAAYVVGASSVYLPDAVWCTSPAMMAGPTLSGAPAGSEPVRRQLDGTLRLTTLDGLYQWDADGTGTLTLLTTLVVPSDQGHFKVSRAWPFGSSARRSCASGGRRA